jgi:hypothetical protein
MNRKRREAPGFVLWVYECIDYLFKIETPTKYEIVINQLDNLFFCGVLAFGFMQNESTLQ